MSADYNGSSEMGVGQPKAAGRKQLPQGPKQCFVMTKVNQEGTNGSSIVPFGAALRESYMHFIAINGYPELTNVGRNVYGSTPAIGLYGPFVATNEGGEHVGGVIHWPLVTTNVGEVAYGSEGPSNTPAMDFYWPFAANSEYDDNIGEAAYGSKVPISNPAGDFSWPVVATNDEEENTGEVAYNSILNLESHDPTTLLRIMMGDKFSTDEVSEQFQNVARLKAPEFGTLLTVMNNAGYGEAPADYGHYDVDKVMTKLEGW